MSICKDVSTEYWSKRKKKTLLHYSDNKTRQMYIGKIYISSAVGNGKYMNYQYDSEQMFIICSNRIKINIVGDELFQCSSENKDKIDDLGITEHGG